MVSFDDLPPADADAQRAAYAAAGLDYGALDDLCGGGGEARMSLQSLDCFFALVAGCPGLVAVQCRGGQSGGAACTHLAALLLRQRHFATTAEALAWMHMVRPGRAAESVDLALLQGQLTAAPAGRQPRARSLSVCVSPGGAPPPPPPPHPRRMSLPRIDEQQADGSSPGTPPTPSSPSPPPALAAASAGPGPAAGPASGARRWSVSGRAFSISSPTLLLPDGGPGSDG